MTNLKFFIGLFAIFFLLSNVIYSQEMDAHTVMQNCIQSHGGAKKFHEIQDIYAKLLVKSYTKDGVFENRLHEYFRQPDKLRIEMEPENGSSTILSWDGKDAYRFVKDKAEKSDDPKLADHIQESLRFIRLMVLTNLIKDSNLKYEKYLKDKNVHIISQTDAKGEKIWLWISGKDFRLQGAKFHYLGDQKAFNIMFIQHHEFEGMILPRHTKLYRENELVMEAWLSLARTNALENKDDFFSDLMQKARLKSITTTPHRRGS
ncbi:MAG: hypothetical protein HUU50_19135 [Candidatus Brocadiae bacterium]|nr:hypothetical protein [Candidatus Brocadiia bacterium]